MRLDMMDDRYLFKLQISLKKRSSTAAWIQIQVFLLLTSKYVDIYILI